MMKSYKYTILLAFLILISSCVNGQELNYWSFQLDGNMTKYFLTDNRSIGLNYGYGLSFSRHIRTIKVSLGFVLCEKDSYEFVPLTQYSSTTKRVSSLIKILNIPLSCNARLYSRNGLEVFALGGIIFNKVLTYDLVNLDSEKIGNQISEHSKNPNINELSLRIGTGVSKKVFPKINLILSAFCDYKAKQDIYYTYPYTPLSKDRYSIGLNFSVEYSFF